MKRIMRKITCFLMGICLMMIFMSQTAIADQSEKSYRIIFDPGEIGGDEHVQTAYFDQPGTLEAYSDEAFGWNSGGRKLHGWAGTGFGPFFGDGASFVNLCGDLPRRQLGDG